MTSSKTKGHGRGRFRENVDAFAIAILMAILMKFFALEAYQIPTSSMQPTMMGHKPTGVFDRIIVDKIRYALPGVVPKRWDIVVFRYPIRQRQNYVKRLVGMPGDRLWIAGGNVYRVVGDDPNDPDHLSVERRPEGVQEEHWKEIFPARHVLRGGGDVLGTAFRSSGGKWSEDADGRLTLRQSSDSSTARLTYTDPDGGLVNRVYDGYPTDIAREIKKEPADFEAVQDARVGFTIRPAATIKVLTIDLAVHRQDGPVLRFQLEAEDGQGRLLVRESDEVRARSEPFELALEGGTSTRVRFAHLDDQCLAWVDGDLVATLETADFKTLVPLRPGGQGNRGTCVLRIVTKGGDEVVFEDLLVERDLHYLPSSRPDQRKSVIIDVGDDYYFMLGDNTLQSVDSRDWSSLTVGVTEDGHIADPRTPGVRTLIGNLRAMPLEDPPDPDENPVIVRSRNKIVFTDEIGEVWVLDGAIAEDTRNGRMYGPGSPWFEGPEGPWEPPIAKDQFVRRDHVLGRPLLNFWPWYRIGFIR